MSRPAWTAFWTLVAAMAAVRLGSVFTHEVNWDEFALLQRAVLTERTGAVVGGGRPGLATLALVPFAAECRNAVDAIVQARLAWTALVALGAVAFWVLLRQLLPDSRHRGTSVALGFALWVLSPAFLLSSTEVRSDQPAFVFALLGGVALVHSVNRVPWAGIAGLLMATGFLFSQKAAYVMALVGLLAVGQLYLRSDWVGIREARRGLFLAAGFLATTTAYATYAYVTGGSSTVVPTGAQFSVFDFYREMVGWRFYAELLPLLVPQFLAVGALILATAIWAAGHRERGRELLLGWVVLALGVVVLVFHAGRFAYFLMIAALFPAMVGAFATEAILGRTTRFLPRAAFLVLMWTPIVLGSLLVAQQLLHDRVERQRDTLAFVERNFDADATGFGGVGAFACRADPDPFPVRFAQHVRAEFWGLDGEARGLELIEQFRERQVAFMILPLESHAYPQVVRDFWDSRYVPYFGSLRVPGVQVRGGTGWAGGFEVLVPGEYRWDAEPGTSGHLLVDDQAVEPGDRIRLTSAGVVQLALPVGGAGTLVLALDEAPSPDVGPFFRGF